MDGYVSIICLSVFIVQKQIFWPETIVKVKLNCEAF